MKSCGYIVIFIAVAAGVGGLIWYNAQDIDDVTSDVVTVNAKKTVIEKTQESDAIVTQREINVLLDEDFESDISDTISETEEGYFDEMDIIIEEDKIIVF